MSIAVLPTNEVYFSIPRWGILLVFINQLFSRQTLTILPGFGKIELIYSCKPNHPKGAIVMSDEQIDASLSQSDSGKNIPTGVRILLRAVSILLCVCLFASLLAMALILDFRLMTSQDTLPVLGILLLVGAAVTKSLQKK